MVTRVRDARDEVRRDVRTEVNSDLQRELAEIRSRGAVRGVNRGDADGDLYDNREDLNRDHQQLSGSYQEKGLRSFEYEQMNTSVNNQHGGKNPFDDYIHEAPLHYDYQKVEPLSKNWEPVVREVSPFNPDEDAKILNKAMKGMGTDEKAIINILARRSNRQRMVIAKQYQLLFKKDLIKDLKSELSGKLEDVIIALMQPPELQDAHSIKEAIAGLGTDEQTLIEIIGSRTPQELAIIKRDYKAEFKTDLEKDLIGDTSGFFRTLLLARLKHADHQASLGLVYQVNMKQAFHEGQALWEKGPKKWPKDEPFFVPIFSGRSDEHLRQVFHDYKKNGRIDIEKDIEKEISDKDARDLFLAIVRVTKNRPAYFAERLHHAMAGIGVNAKSVIRIIVSRSEKDLGTIKHEYARMYGRPLETAIAEEFSGDAKRVLLAVLTQQPAK